MPATLLWILALLLMAVGLAGIVIPALPGVPLMFAGMLIAAWIDDFTRIGVPTLVVLGILTVSTLVIDVAAGAFGARRLGASRGAIAGSAIGTVFGLFFGLPGLLLGPFLGAMVGEFAARRRPGEALRVGVASWLAFVFGTLLKVGIAFAMLGIFVLVLLVG